MRKLRTEPHVEAHDSRRGTNVRALVIGTLGIVLCPIAYEAALLCTANWQSMWGQAQYVETPIISTLGDLWQALGRSMRERSTSMFENLPWKPSLVITFGILWAIFMSVPLRRR